MIRKFYSNKAKPGWKHNEQFGKAPKTADAKTAGQDCFTKKYYSWGLDLDLEPTRADPDGKSIRRRYRESGFLTRQLAERAAAKIVTEQKEIKHGLKRPAAAPCPTLFDLSQKRLETLRERKTRVREGRVLQLLLETLPAKIKINEVKTPHLIEFREKRFADGLKASSVMREMTVISALLHSAPDFYPEQLAEWNAPKIPRPKVEGSKRERVISRDEIERILTELYRPAMPDESPLDAINRRKTGLIFHFQLLTSARKSEVETVLKSGVDRQAGIVQVRGSKTRFSTKQATRYVPITPTALRVIEEATALSNGDYVFTPNGSIIKDFYRFMKEACNRAGIPYGRRTVGGVIARDSRHTFITRATQAGKDLSTVGSISGHADKSLTLHYSHASEESRQNLMEVSEDFAGWDFAEN